MTYPLGVGLEGGDIEGGTERQVQLSPRLQNPHLQDRRADGCADREAIVAA